MLLSLLRGIILTTGTTCILRLAIAAGLGDTIGVIRTGEVIMAGVVGTILGIAHGTVVIMVGTAVGIILGTALGIPVITAGDTRTTVGDIHTTEVITDTHIMVDTTAMDTIITIVTLTKLTDVR